MTVNWAVVNKRTGIVEWFEHDGPCPYRGHDEWLDHMRRAPLSDACDSDAVVQTLKFRLVSKNLYPPIPDRSMDWGVYVEGLEDCGYQSFGKTEGGAISDFLENYEPC